MLSDITRIEGQNTGGNRMIYFAPIGDLFKIPAADNRQVTTEVIFRAGRSWLRCECSPESRGYEEQNKQSEQSPLCQISVSGFVRSDSSGLRTQLDLMTYMRFVAMVRDNDNQLRLVGNAFEQLDFTWSFSGGRRVADLKGYQVGFSGLFRLPAPFYLAEL